MRSDAFPLHCRWRAARVLDGNWNPPPRGWTAIGTRRHGGLQIEAVAAVSNALDPCAGAGRRLEIAATGWHSGAVAAVPRLISEGR